MVYQLTGITQGDKLWNKCVLVVHGSHIKVTAHVPEQITVQQKTQQKVKISHGI